MRPGCSIDHPRPSSAEVKERVEIYPVAYPVILFGGCGGSTNSVEDRENGDLGQCPLVRGSGGSCNLVQEISFHIVKFS
jgi:hypothetical protein